MSWIVTRRATGEVVGGFFDRRLVDLFDREICLVEEVGDYLARINLARIPIDTN